jgi:CRISPR type III-A-associated RAMP protein Csm4
MATYTIFKLKNLTPLHIGTGKENYDFSADDLQSDTISAALAAIRALQGKSDDIEQFLNSFTISSAFPYSSEHYFLPKMQGKLNVEVKDVNKDEKRKELKKIKYIEIPLWERLSANEQLKVADNQLQKKFLLANALEFIQPAKSQVMQRVTVPRSDGQDAEPFYFDWTYFNAKGGLYFLINASTEVEEELLDLFEQLGEAGIGTDRNIGGGKFEVEKDTIEIKDQPKANATMLLSLFVPTKQELEKIYLTNSRYQLLLRGGFMAGSVEEDFRHLRKKSVYMFGVGSVFPIKETLQGKVVNLTPEWNDERMHPVYRSGKPFYLPVTI